jgi:Disulphide bond corrector protein DsbC
MKGKILTGLGFFVCFSAVAQEPVKWSFSMKKLTPLKYLLVMTASIDNPWHTYSQFTPKGGPYPTTISFTQSPLIQYNGTPKEEGNLREVYDDGFDVNVKYFEKKVSFVEEVDLKAVVKTTVAGKITFMACTDGKCLPPATKEFHLPIGE